MKKSFATDFCILLIIFSLLSVNVGTVQATSSVNEEISISPQNPEYVEYLNKNSGLIGTASIDETTGIIPLPVELPSYKCDDSNNINNLIGSLPTKYDSRDYGYVSSIKDQAVSGPCWSFAYTSAMESNLKKLQSTSYDISENHMLYSTSSYGNNVLGFNRSPHAGGNYFFATAYYMRWGGPVLESSDPFPAQGPFDTVRSASITNSFPTVKHVESVIHLPNLSSSATDSEKTAHRNKTKELINTYGSACLSTYYDSAYSNSADTAYYYNGTSKPNHGVTIIGWDDNYSRDNFNSTLKPVGNGAWLIKNSWGNYNSLGGYYYISYYDSNAENSITAIKNVGNTNNYNNIYQYDPLSYSGSFSYASTTAEFANVFSKTNSSETLKAISYFNLKQNVDYQVYVNANLSASTTSLTGVNMTLVAQGTLTDTGYITIPITPTSISGAKFAVSVRITTRDGTNALIPVEVYDPIMFTNASASPYQSYSRSTTAMSWGDVTTLDPALSEANVCLKAYTSSGTPTPSPSPSPTGTMYVTTSTPTSNATGVGINDSISLTYNQTITGLNSAGITIKTSGGTTVTRTTGLLGNTLTIGHSSPLNYNTTYIVTVPSGCVTGASGAINADYTLSFTTGSPPISEITLLSTNPLNNATGVDVFVTPSFTFDQNVTYNANCTERITYKTASGTAVNKFITYDGGTMVIANQNSYPGPVLPLAYNTTYIVILPAGYCKNPITNATSPAITITFTTKSSASEPTIQSSNPQNNQVEAPPETIPTITYNQNIMQSINYDYITFKKSDNTSVDFTKSITGGTISFTPSSALAENTKYNIKIPAGAIKNSSGNSSSTDYTLTFTTGIKSTLESDFTFNETSGTITGYIGAGGDVVIPSTINGVSVKNIGDSAFSSNDGLTSVKIPSSVISIGDYAFGSCSSLTAINVDTNNAYYSSTNGVLFNKNKTLLIQCPSKISGAYTIPNSVTSIGNYAFDSCSNLTSISIPSTVTSIGDGAFGHCSGLTSISIPSSVTNISDFAFKACSNLTAINIDTNNAYYSSIVGVLFNKNKTKLIRYPEGKSGAYTVPSGVTSIEDGAFLFCSGLTSISISNSVTSIGNYAFDSCSNLASISIPNSVTSIGGDAFYSCSNLASISIPSSVTSIGDSSFGYCSKLTAINVDTNNANYSSINGVLFNKNKTLLIQYPAGLYGAYNIPDTVTSMSDYAFSDCSGLTSVIIPGSVTSLSCGAFMSCTSLQSVNIPSSVTSIESNAFYSCSSLKSAYFEGNAPSMGWIVFDQTATGFTVYFKQGATGFTTPEWEGYTCVEINPPTLSSTNPTANATGVAITIAPTFIYSQNIYPGTAYTAITFKDDNGNAIAFNPTVSFNVLTITPTSSLSYSKHYTITLPAGSLENSAADATLTSSTLSFTTQAATTPQISYTTIAPPYNTTASFTDSDGLAPNGNYAKGYSFSGTKGQSVEVTLSSSSIDCFLYLLNSDKSELTTNDDGDKTSTNSKIIYTLPYTGQYYILASEFKKSIGSYAIDVKLTSGQSVSIDSLILADNSGTQLSLIALGQTVYITSAISGSATGAKVVFAIYNNEKLIKINTLAFNGGGTYKTSFVLPEMFGDLSCKAFLLKDFGSLEPLTLNKELQFDTYTITPPAFPESAHNYINNFDNTWVYTFPVTCKSLMITFAAETKVEQNYDFIYLITKDGSTPYTGTTLAGKTITLNGNTFSVRLTTDKSGTEYGFRITNIVPVY